MMLNTIQNGILSQILIGHTDILQFWIILPFLNSLFFLNSLYKERSCPSIKNLRVKSHIKLLLLLISRTIQTYQNSFSGKITKIDHTCQINKLPSTQMR